MLASTEMDAFHSVVHGIVYKALKVRRRLAKRCVEIVRIKRQSSLEETARTADIVGISSLVEPRHPLKIEIHRIGRGRPLRAVSLVSHQLAPQLAGQTGDDVILHAEE